MTDFFANAPRTAAALERGHRHLAAAFFEQLDGGLLFWRERARRRFEHDEPIVADALRVAQAIGNRDHARVAQPRHRRARARLDRGGVRQRAFLQLFDQRHVAFPVVDRQRHLARAARRHVRRQRDAQHLTERREVVLGGPAAEVQDRRAQRPRGAAGKLTSNGVESWLSRAICEPATTMRPLPFTPSTRSPAVPLVNCGKRSAASTIIWRPLSTYMRFEASVTPRASSSDTTMSSGMPATSAK